MSLATREIYSPNYYRRGWVYGPPKVVFIHSTRSGIEGHTHEKELASTINHFASLGSQASAHWIISPTERVRMVPDVYPSWCTGFHNFEGYNIELTQPTAGTPYQPGHYRNLVMVCAPYAKQGIPIVKLDYWAYAQDQPRGFVGHEDTQQGRSVGKSDPGRMFNWGEFLALLGTEMEDMMPWSNWESMEGQAIGGPAVTSWDKGRLDLFVVGTNNALYHKWYARRQGWQGWENLGAPQGIQLVGSPSAVSWEKDRVDVFVRGDNRKTYHLWFAK